MIDICWVGSGVKSHSLSYWSIVMTSPVEFSSGEFRTNQKKIIIKDFSVSLKNQLCP